MEPDVHYLIDDTPLQASDADLQDRLAAAYHAGKAPRCLCVDSGVDMYIAKYREYVIKRKPDTGHHHAPWCPSYEPAASQSGLGEILGDAVVMHEDERIEVRLDFPMTRSIGRAGARGEPAAHTDVRTQRRRLGLKGLLHLLWERAGFNRWYPHLAGKRSWWVLRTRLLAAAEHIDAKGARLSERLYIPEAFQLDRVDDIVARRTAALSVLVSASTDSQYSMLLVIGELKAFTETDIDYRLVLKHMADCPLYMEKKAAERLKRAFEAEYTAWAHQKAAQRERGADHAAQPALRLIFTALIYAKRENVFVVDTATLMLVSANWVPLDYTYEQPLVHALTQQNRRFLKPLRYESRQGPSFPNFLLLDVGPAPLALDIVSPFLPAKHRVVKDKAMQRRDQIRWVWETAETPLPPALPAPSRVFAMEGDLDQRASRNGVGS